MGFQDCSTGLLSFALGFKQSLVWTYSIIRFLKMQRTQHLWVTGTRLCSSGPPQKKPHKSQKPRKHRPRYKKPRLPRPVMMGLASTSDSGGLPKDGLEGLFKFSMLLIILGLTLGEGSPLIAWTRRLARMAESDMDEVEK